VGTSCCRTRRTSAARRHNRARLLLRDRRLSPGSSGAISGCYIATTVGVVATRLFARFFTTTLFHTIAVPSTSYLPFSKPTRLLSRNGDIFIDVELPFYSMHALVFCCACCWHGSSRLTAGWRVALWRYLNDMQRTSLPLPLYLFLALGGGTVAGLERGRGRAQRRAGAFFSGPCILKRCHFALCMGGR